MERAVAREKIEQDSRKKDQARAHLRNNCKTKWWWSDEIMMHTLMLGAPKYNGIHPASSA